MPIIIPILAGAAVISGIGYGLKKSLQARKDFSEASRTGSQAESRYKLAAQSERASKQQTLYYLQALGELKKQVFLNQIQHLVSVLEQAKKAGAELSDFSSELTITELHRISSLVEKTHEIEAGLIAGTATGALAAFGAFSTAGILGTASTGTAVSTLTGAAASNATLAWFGGGSLAAGGFGMAGGMVILGGIVVAPVFAAGGLVMARKAQKAVKEARDYADKVDKELLLMQKAEAAMQEIRTAADALGQVILRLARRFEQVKVCSCTDPGFRSMVQTGLTLKKLLDIPVMRQDGTANPEVKERCRECLDRAHLDTASFMQDFHDPKVQDMKL